VIRSDVGEAHRLSLSARVLSAQHTQVKAKTAVAEALLTRIKCNESNLQITRKTLRQSDRSSFRRILNPQLGPADGRCFKSPVVTHMGTMDSFCQRPRRIT
jgi:hypothetical protein